ncbi:hypothetical protein B5V46_03785 [Rhodovulum sp. MB263]|nr:hypothetical protein B5V46_03785 [Rhodovulum sp. MB263]
MQGGIFALYFLLMFEGLKTAAPVSTAVVTLPPDPGLGVTFVGPEYHAGSARWVSDGRPVGMSAAMALRIAHRIPATSSLR